MKIILSHVHKFAVRNDWEGFSQEHPHPVILRGAHAQSLDPVSSLGADGWRVEPMG